MKRLFGKWAGSGLRRGRFVALDFDSRQVRIVQADLSPSGVRISKLAAAEIPKGLDLADPKAVGRLVGQTVSRLHLGRVAAAMCIPRGQAVLKPLVLPPASDPGERAAMVQYQAEKELAFRPQEAVVDFALESHYGAEHAAEEQPGGEHVLVAAVQQPVVNFYRQVAEAAGLRLVRLGLRPYANLQGIQAYGRHSTESRLAVVYITHDEAEIDVMEGGALSFSRAAVVKVPPPGPDAEPAAGEAARIVVAEVARSLHSYLGVEGGHGIATIVVAGGTGIEPRVAAELKRRLSVPTEIWDPARTLGLEESGPAASAFLSALGLAASQAPESLAPFDFLSPKRPPVRRDTRKILVASGIAGVALVLAGILVAAGIYYGSAQARLTRLKEEYDTLKEGDAQVKALQKRVAALDQWVAGDGDWLGQWANLSAILPSCTDIYVTNLKSEPDGWINFTVKARSSAVINDLDKRLRVSGYVFKPGPENPTGDAYGYIYLTSRKVKTDGRIKVDLRSAPESVRPADDVSAEEFGRATPRPVAPTSPGRSPAPPRAATEVWPTGPSTSPSVRTDSPARARNQSDSRRPRAAKPTGGGSP